MDLTGKKVIHKAKFGEGVICEQNETYVWVQFADGKKQFSYPSCFHSFLKLLDTQSASAVHSVLEEVKKKEKEAKEKARQEVAARNFAGQSQQGRRSSRSERNVTVRPFATVSSFCEQYEKALIAEIAYLRNNGGKKQHLFDGHLVENKNENYTYSFETDSELNYPDGTPITLWAGSASYPATIMGCEDFTVIISVSVSLGKEIPSIDFSAEPWRLINSLIERLRILQELPASSIVQELVCDGFKNIRYDVAIEKGQDTACKFSTTKPITFVWGPPGTGKTETLARIALQHIELHQRVLMLSYSNVSVDGAIERVFKLDENQKAGKLVRYGYPRNKDLMQHPYLTSYNLAIHNHPDLLKERTGLLDERKKTSRTSTRYVEIGARLTKIRELLREEEKAAVKLASFVATTVSKAVVDKEIYNSHFDVVIFDEASMAYIPQIIFAASLASKHFICMGDFAQLPPIVQNSPDSILNADIFQYCGITNDTDAPEEVEFRIDIAFADDFGFDL